MSMLRIAMWSGPRNISTAMMRAFENRSDCTVSDEPLYAAFLHQTGLDHPGAAEVIADGECDWRRVAEAMTGPIPGGKPLWYQKHMSHHLLPGMDREWIHGLSNAFLIRHPNAVVASYIKSRAEVVPEDIGLVIHDWTPRMSAYAGIDHRRDQVASAAVDLVATQLLHHEFGLPALPRQVLISPEWVDGPSVRPWSA